MLYAKYSQNPRVLCAVLTLILSGSALACLVDPRYESAVRDTAVMKANNQRTLTPIQTQTENFVVWTDYTGYQPNGHYSMPLNLFVARESEMKAACQKLARHTTSGRLKDKINQLLGLPKYDAPQKFVQISMYVEQPNNALLANYSDASLGQALFRPCGDPNVHSDHCGTDFASDVSDEFKLWIYQKTRQSYHESTEDAATHKMHYGYPWTDLGYTYNWGADDHFGLQEFVVKKGAEVAVKQQADGSAYLEAKDFCR